MVKNDAKTDTDQTAGVTLKQQLWTDLVISQGLGRLKKSSVHIYYVCIKFKMTLFLREVGSLKGANNLSEERNVSQVEMRVEYT